MERGLNSPHAQPLSRQWQGRAAAVSWKWSIISLHAWLPLVGTILISERFIWKWIQIEITCLSWVNPVILTGQSGYPLSLCRKIWFNLGSNRGLFSLPLIYKDWIQFSPAVIFGIPTCPFQFLRTSDTPAVWAWRHKWKLLRDVRLLERELHCYLSIASPRWHLAQNLRQIRTSYCVSR